MVHSLLTCAPSSFEQVQCRAARSPNPAAPAQTTVLVLRWAAGEHQSRETDDCGAVQKVLHHCQYLHPRNEILALPLTNLD